MDSLFQLYDQSNFQDLLSVHSSVPSGLIELLKTPSTDLISNVDTQVKLISFNNAFCPITVNQAEYDNALICSPYTTYVTYPLDELDKFGKKWIKVLVLFNALIMGCICRLTKINKAVQVNNNLNSLLVHPKSFEEMLPKLTQELISRYPQHAITLFRVNDRLNKNLLSVLQENGYIVFPDRVAHVFFPESGFIKRSHTKRDLSLLCRSEYKLVCHDELTDEDAKRFAELYRMLFVDKHSQMNPLYTERYFSQAIKNHWHHYVALRNPSGCIDAFISWFQSEGILFCGPLGYDEAIPQNVGLYRQLVALCLQYSDEHQIPFNMGGGSDTFKVNRGSTETLEYTAVYCQHLPFYRHLPWRLLSWACRKFLKKIVDSSQL